MRVRYAGFGSRAMFPANYARPHPAQTPDMLAKADKWATILSGQARDAVSSDALAATQVPDAATSADNTSVVPVVAPQMNVVVVPQATSRKWLVPALIAVGVLGGAYLVWRK